MLCYVFVFQFGSHIALKISNLIKAKLHVIPNKLNQ